MIRLPTPAKPPLQQNVTKASLITSLAALLAACGGGESTTSSDTTPIGNGGQDAPVGSDNDASGGQPVKVSLIVNNANNTSVSEKNVDELDIVFQVSASFDAKVLDDNAIINLGLDRNGDEMASLGRADFDELSFENATLNIHASQKNVEIDYKKGVEGNLTINFENDGGAIIVGEDDFRTSPNQAIQIFDAKTLEVHHQSSQSATVQGTILVDDFTQDILVTSSKIGGDLALIGSELKPTFTDTGEVKTVTVNGLYGDIQLISFDTLHGDSHLLDDSTNFQTLDVTGHDSAIEVGSIGLLPTLLTATLNPATLQTDYTTVGFASDLETINISLSGTASLYQHPIAAHGSDIAEVNIKTGAGSDVQSNFNFNTTVAPSKGNVVIEAFAAQTIEQMVIDTSNGGGVVLDSQSYLVNTLTFVGSGEIIIAGADQRKHADATAGGNPGFQQSEAADASDHTGDRSFVGRIGADVIYGSDGDDLIVFQGFQSVFPPVLTDIGDAYYDSGGDDVVHLGGFENVQVFDGDAGSNDTYLVNFIPFGSGFSPSALNFFAGSGFDTIDFGISLSFFPDVVSIDLGTWLNGRVDINNFTTNEHKISLDGLPGITTAVVTTLAPGTTLNHIDDNKIYIGLNGDQAVNGHTISDYHDLEEVAEYLNAVVSDSSQNGDSAVFILQNGTTSSASGDEAEYYFYLFNEADEVSGVDEAELENFASLSVVSGGFPPSPPLSAGDFV